MVVYRDDDFPGALTRWEWVARAYPDASSTIVADMKTQGDEQSGAAAWAELTYDLLDGHYPDAVFSSEDYGAYWAEAMGCEHVLVDQARVAVPISGTIIRSNPYKHLDFIHPVARDYFLGNYGGFSEKSDG